MDARASWRDLRKAADAILTMRDGTHLSLCRPLLLKSLVSASSEASVEERCCILQKAFEELRHLLSAKSSPEQKTSAQTAFSRPSINDSQQCSSLPLRAVNNRVMLSAPADQEAVLTSGGLNTHPSFQSSEIIAVNSPNRHLIPQLDWSMTPRQHQCREAQG